MLGCLFTFDLVPFVERFSARATDDGGALLFGQLVSNLRFILCDYTSGLLIDAILA